MLVSKGTEGAIREAEGEKKLKEGRIDETVK
jgi:hypothetical protein